MQLPVARLIKGLILAILLTCCYLTYASVPDYELIKDINKSGHPMVWIENHTNKTIHCYIGYRYDYDDFYVEPYSSSEQYFEPEGEYFWGCK